MLRNGAGPEFGKELTFAPNCDRAPIEYAEAQRPPPPPD